MKLTEVELYILIGMGVIGLAALYDHWTGV